MQVKLSIYPDDITEEVATVHPMQQQPVYGGDSLLSTIQVCYT